MTEIVITEEIDMIGIKEMIETIEVTEDAIMKEKEIVMTEIVTEMTEEEIAQDLTQIRNHPLKAAIVVIERKRSKEEDAPEAEYLMFWIDWFSKALSLFYKSFWINFNFFGRKC